MPLGKGIVEVLEAIPERIEVSGQPPTWRVTGGSFESALSFAREAYGETTVIAREDRNRWWPRVTLTVTTDPTLTAKAPALETFAKDPEPKPEPTAASTESKGRRGWGRIPAQRAAEPEPYPPVLEDIFAHQEAMRRERLHIPQQRTAA